MMGRIKFSKFNGQGNDFIIIDAFKTSENLTREQIIKICDRHFGIGADGLIMVKKSARSDLRMDYYNRDGSTAEMCGNGIRCMAAFAYYSGLIRRRDLTIETLAGEKTLSIDIENGRIGNISVDMGTPEFDPASIPVLIKNRSEVFNYKIKVGERSFYINCVSIGNPHCVIFLDEDTDLKDYNLKNWGPKIENLKIFPYKTNVEFVNIKNREELDLRVWERGVGETLACGTGACAAVVCAIKTKKEMYNKISVNLLGGKVDVIWDSAESSIYLSGRVDHNFDGIYNL
jgi:diaminopimelate epimerase